MLRRVSIGVNLGLVAIILDTLSVYPIHLRVVTVHIHMDIHVDNDVHIYSNIDIDVYINNQVDIVIDIYVHDDTNIYIDVDVYILCKYFY